MRKARLYIWAFLAVSLIVGCEDHSEQLQEVYFPTGVDYGSTPLGLSPELGTIPGEGVKNKAVTLYAVKQMPWRMSDLPSWLSFSQQNGTGNTELAYTAKQNPSVTMERTAYFFLESEMESLPLRKTVSAHQFAQPKTFAVTPNNPSYTFDSEGGTLELNVTSNQKWCITRATGEFAFAELSHTEDSADAVVTVTIPPYNSLDVRALSNTLRFVDASSNQVLYEFQVIQTPPAVSTGMVEKTLIFGKEGETLSLSLGSAPSYSVQCDLAWADVTPTSGIGEVKLNISTSPNWSTTERSGYAYVYVEGELKAKIHLVQNAYQFTLHKTTYSIAAEGGYVAFDLLTSDGAWKATTEANWIKVSPEIGNAGKKQTISFTVLPNNSLDSRIATVCFERTDDVVLKTEFTVVQQGCYFNAGDWTNGIQLGPDAQSSSCNFDCNLSWTASANVSWISLINNSGSPNKEQTILFTVTANSTQESRVGEILISYNGGETKIPVVQESAYLNSSSETITFASTGGSHAVSISSNSGWIARTDASWLTLSKRAGNGQVELTLTAADNPSNEVRSAVVIFKLGANGVEKKLAISQKGRYLNVPVSKINFLKKGGEQSFNIDSDGKLEASSSCAWLQAKIETGNVLVLTADENTSGTERSAIVSIKLSDLQSGKLERIITINQSSVKTITVNGVSFNMILVEHGTFDMGKRKPLYGFDVPFTVHSVTLTKDYYVGETEVTQELWTAVMGSNPSFSRGLQQPVESVSWNTINDEFLPRLNNLTGLNFRLPTEAEWEFAARGGNYSKGYNYSGSDGVGEVGVHGEVGIYGCVYENPQNVKTKLHNELGIYDMTGNVSEWCQDWYEEYGTDAQIDPVGPNSNLGLGKAYRGGSYSEEMFANGDGWWKYEVVVRRNCDPLSTSDKIGFRLALTIE